MNPHRASLLLTTLVSAIMLNLASCTPTPTETVRLRILHTSDVHGHVLDALPRVAAYAEACRAELGRDHVIMTDGGDVLQGHPAAYYYNFVDTASRHIVAETMNRIGYDVAVIGNHDLETGHDVYDRWISECDFPVLGANVIDERTGEPYLKPYEVIECEGIRIALLGLLTPAVPNWVPKPFWEHLRFEDMVECARKWIPIIQEQEEPHLIVGVFHSGINEDQGIQTDDYCENESRLVAQQVSGFDLILYGHDHRRHIERVMTPDGDSIYCIGPTSTGTCICEINIEVQVKRRAGESPRVMCYKIEGKVVDMKDAIDAQAVADSLWFPEASAAVKAYMAEPVGMITSTLHERNAFFGPSAFMDLIHDLQLELSQGAVISFAAPLSFDATIEQGMTHISDMFALYKYENLLYTMRMTGREIRDFLEMSYDLWTNTMTRADDHILLMDSILDGGKRLGLRNMAFNFDSAAGIRYTVDVSKPDGQKVTILSMEDGEPFEMDKEYLVATNSYRGNGGGELMTRGAGIALNELPKRVVACSDHDLRYLLIETLRQRGSFSPRTRSNWRFIPDEWAPAAVARDREILFTTNATTQP